MHSIRIFGGSVYCGMDHLGFHMIMIFQKPKDPRKRIEAVLGRLDSGKCDDSALKDMEEALRELNDEEESLMVKGFLLANIESSTNINTLTYSIKAVIAIYPMEPARETVVKRMASILKVPVNGEHKRLHEAISRYFLISIGKNVDVSRMVMPQLISLLNDRFGTIGSDAYETLSLVALKRPGYFRKDASLLIKMLGSINRSTRAESARLICTIANVHPEYFFGAISTLEYLSIFHPDATIKNTASEAYQIISLKVKEAQEKEDKARALTSGNGNGNGNGVSEPSTGGWAEVMRRKVTNGEAEAVLSPEPVPETPLVLENGQMPVTVTSFVELVTPENNVDTDLKELMEKVKADFSNNAGDILNTLGISHLAKNEKKANKDPPNEAAAPVAEKAEAAPVRSILSGVKVGGNSKQNSSRGPSIISSVIKPLPAIDKMAAAVAASEESTLRSIESMVKGSMPADAPVQEKPPMPDDTTLLSLESMVKAPTPAAAEKSKGAPPTATMMPTVKPRAVKPGEVPQPPRPVRVPVNAPAIEYSFKCPTCSVPLPADARYCIACGTRVTARQKSRCERCGTINVGNARYCVNCGVRMNA